MATDGVERAVEWERAAPPATPVAVERPLVELILEHPVAESRVGTAFFPDAVPYERDGRRRLFYWRTALSADPPSADRWRAVSATTDDLAPVVEGERGLPPLTRECAGGQEVVVEGTIAGDTTTAVLGEYDPPAVRLAAVDANRVELAVRDPAADGAENDDTTVTDRTTTRRVGVDAGDRTAVSLPAREVVHRDRGERVTVAPRLRVRYPGERLVVHPAAEGDYTLFPSFGLDLEEVPNPLSVAADGATIDEEAVAEAAGALLADRPYAERVLWQAFCYTAFDPVDEARPTLAQFDSGRIAVGE